MTKKIIVTGGAGFLGSHLCNKLVNENNDVFCIDNFYTGRKCNISHLLLRDNFHLINADISRQINFFTDVDEIYNLACPASPPHYQKDPVHTIETNVNGTLQMLKQAREAGAKILQASTSEVYGDPDCHPQSEEYWGNVNPLGIRSCYDEGKRVAETLCSDFLRQYNVDTKIVRIFNTYGPNMAINDGRVISNFIIQALKGEPLTMYGDGSQSRAFQYVDDLIDGITKMMQSSCHGPINIGNPNEFTMLELAEIIIELINSNSKIIYSNLPKDDPKRRRPNITKAKIELNWEPKVGLKDGLKKTINYFQNII